MLFPGVFPGAGWRIGGCFAAEICLELWESSRSSSTGSPQGTRVATGVGCCGVWCWQLWWNTKYIINFISTCFPKDTMFIYVWTFFSGSFLAQKTPVFSRHQDHKDLVEAAKQRKPPPGLTMQELCCLQTLLLTSFHGATNFGDPLPRWKTQKNPTSLMLGVSCWQCMMGQNLKYHCYDLVCIIIDEKLY